MNHTIKVVIIGLISLGIGFFAGMEYKAYQVRSAFQSTANKIFNTADTSSDQLPDEKETNIAYVDKSVGEEVVLATINFKVNNYGEKQTLSGGFGSPAIAKEGAKFVVVDLNNPSR
jgi:hypothetical protein